jgi:hypothetical protein
MGHCRKTDKFWLGKELSLPTFMFPCQQPCRVEHTSSRPITEVKHTVDICRYNVGKI